LGLTSLNKSKNREEIEVEQLDQKSTKDNEEYDISRFQIDPSEKFKDFFKIKPLLKFLQTKIDFNFSATIIFSSKRLFKDEKEDVEKILIEILNNIKTCTKI
jgi:hypothetical protein